MSILTYDINSGQYSVMEYSKYRVQKALRGSNIQYVARTDKDWAQAMRFHRSVVDGEGVK